MNADRYLALSDFVEELTELDDVDEPGFYCRDCHGFPFVPAEDVADHNRLHVELDAAANPDQGNLFDTARSSA